MEAKIAEILGCQREDKKGDCGLCSWPEEQCPVVIQRKVILALIAADRAEILNAIKTELLGANRMYILLGFIEQALKEVQNG